jgi:hypothetical protein
MELAARWAFTGFVVVMTVTLTVLLVELISILSCGTLAHVSSAEVVSLVITITAAETASATQPEQLHFRE